MIKTSLKINGIPAILWGKPAERLFIAVHGFQSNKEDDTLVCFSEEATHQEYQVLSFDLPEHGERKGDGTPCTPLYCLNDLAVIMNHAQTLSNHVSLFAVSLGAYYSLLAYQGNIIKRCLFLSPLLDMKCFIQNTMAAYHISEDRLKTEKVIDLPSGQPLDWDYYCYVMAHPIEKWSPPTAILYGSEDTVTDHQGISKFVEHFHCTLEVLEGSGHYFHTTKQMRVFREWLKKTPLL